MFARCFLLSEERLAVGTARPAVVFAVVAGRAFVVVVPWVVLVVKGHVRSLMLLMRRVLMGEVASAAWSTHLEGLTCREEKFIVFSTLHLSRSSTKNPFSLRNIIKYRKQKKARLKKTESLKCNKKRSPQNSPRIDPSVPEAEFAATNSEKRIGNAIRILKQLRYLRMPLITQSRQAGGLAAGSPCPGRDLRAGKVPRVLAGFSVQCCCFFYS